MTDDAENLLSPGQRSRRGVWSDWRAAPPVTASDIRRWAIAVYWPEPPPSCYLEPPDPFAGRMAAPQELNPFAWLPGGPPRTSVRPGVRRVLGGCRIRYGQPIRVGDVIRARSQLEGWQSKRSAGGPMLLVDYRHEWRNQIDEAVREADYTLILRGRPDAA